MSWQEELRRLDEELASGRLSADDYRIRRDQVLSSAVGQQDQPAPQQQTPSADSTQVIAPVSPPGGTPQQAPQPQQPPQPPADEGAAERTQIVQGWQTQQPGADAGPERTQVVQPQQHPQTHYSPPGGFQQPVSPAGGFPQQQPWNAPESDQTPPWGGGDLPPLGPAGGDSFQQGPEFFAEKPKNGNGKKIGAIVAAVVVLAGIAFGAYLLWGRDNSSGAGPQQSTAQQPQGSSGAPKPADALAVATMPGKIEPHKDVTSFAQVNNLNYLNSDELAAYQTAGASKSKIVVYRLPDGNKIIALLTEASSPVAARTGADKLMKIQITNGATRDTTAPNGVSATTIDPKNGNQGQDRAHYAHGNVIIRIEVTGPATASLKADFTAALNSQLALAPADV